MKRIWIFMILIACPAAMFGQSNGSGSSAQGSTCGSSGNPPYQPAVPPSSTTVYGGGEWGYGGAQTPAGAALARRAQVINSAGQYNLATSAGAVNLTQAESNEMRNQVQAVRAYWEIRDFARLEREKERGPRPDGGRTFPPRPCRRPPAQARGRSIRPAAPCTGLSSCRMPVMNHSARAERVHGQVAEIRGTGLCRSVQVRENIDVMYDVLKSQIASIPPQDYMESRAFLASLKFATTRSVL